MKRSDAKSYQVLNIVGFAWEIIFYSKAIWDVKKTETKAEG
jgi:hypothetical protein